MTWLSCLLLGKHFFWIHFFSVTYPGAVSIILFPYSLETRITQSVKEVGDILIGIKGGGQISSMNQPPPRGMVSAEADEVLRPLMDLLDGK